jgi:hypothetical protein
MCRVIMPGGEARWPGGMIKTILLTGLRSRRYIMNGTISSHVIIMQSEYRNGVSELKTEDSISIGDKQTYEREWIPSLLLFQGRQELIR